MSLSLEEVEHIALLARLRLTDEEKARYRKQLSAILEYVERLSELDTANIQPTSSVLPPETTLRKDEPRLGLSLEQLLKNAPEVDDGEFKVPPILD